MTLQKTLVRGKIFNPLAPEKWEYFEQGALVISAEGRIEAIGRYQDLEDTPGIQQTLDYSNYLILPGLIDMHTHLPQLPIRGKTAGTLMEWLDHYAFPIETAFAENHYARRLSQVFFESLKQNGTTTALVLSSVHFESTEIAFEEALKSGMRVLMGKVMMDRNAPGALLETLEASVEDSETLAKRWHGQNRDLIRYAFTPRFAVSCTPGMLEAASELHRKYPFSYLHSHLSENLNEIKAVQALFGEKDSYTAVYEKTGCLGPRTIMAHAIHLSPNELEILEATQTRIAHCPTSNFFLKSGFFNWQAFLEHNILFGLGSDVGGGPDISMFRVMRGMDEVQLGYQRFVPPATALYYATLGGAKALSLEEETGNLSPGKSADFIVLEPDAFEPLGEETQSIEEVISQWMYLGQAQYLYKTYVRGKCVYLNPTMDLEKDLTGFHSTRLRERLKHPQQMQ